MTERRATREAVYQRFAAVWGGLTPLALPDDPPFDPVNGTWARLSLKHTGGAQETMGAPGDRKFARSGSIFVQLFTPPGRGEGSQDDLIDAALKVFEGCNIPGSDILLFDPVGRDIGEIENGRWWASTVEVQFSYSVTR